MLGPFPTTPQGNKYFLVGVEYLSRWPITWPVPDQSAATIMDAFLHGARAPEVCGAACYAAGFGSNWGRTSIVRSFLSSRTAFSFSTSGGAAPLGPALSHSRTPAEAAPTPSGSPVLGFREADVGGAEDVVGKGGDPVLLRHSLAMWPSWPHLKQTVVDLHAERGPPLSCRSRSGRRPSTPLPRGPQANDAQVCSSSRGAGSSGTRGVASNHPAGQQRAVEGKRRLSTSPRLRSTSPAHLGQRVENGGHLSARPRQSRSIRHRDGLKHRQRVIVQSRRQSPQTLLVGPPDQGAGSFETLSSRLPLPRTCRREAGTFIEMAPPRKPPMAT
ncbi:unnamed protein product [Lampetra fluviatilis]